MVANETGRGKIGIHVLVVIFGITSWSIMNGLWVELPILVSHLPEGWTLPSYLTIISQFGNIGPIFFSLLAYCAPKTKLETPVSALIVIMLALCSLLYAFLWSNTVTIAGTSYSVALHTLTCIQAIFASTTSMAYLAFMAHLKACYMGSIFVGMGFSGLLPAFAAIGQGPGEVSCVNNAAQQSLNRTHPLLLQNASRSEEFPTLDTDPSHNVTAVIAVNVEPAFSVQAFFLMLFGLCVFSLLSFLALIYHPYCKTEHVDTDKEEHCQLMETHTSKSDDNNAPNRAPPLPENRKHADTPMPIVCDQEIPQEPPDEHHQYKRPTTPTGQLTSVCPAHNANNTTLSLSSPIFFQDKQNSNASVDETKAIPAKPACQYFSDYGNHPEDTGYCKVSLGLENSDQYISHQGETPESGADRGEDDGQPNEKQYISKYASWYLLALSVWINMLQTSFVLAIQVYSSLPYGLYFYNAVTKAENIVDPIASFFSIFVMVKSVPAISGLTLLGTLFTAYIITVAAMSPDPFLADQTAGGVLVIAAWVMCTVFMVYSKVSIARVMRDQGRLSLMWTGASTQCGALIGAILAYVLINELHIFRDQPWCV